MPPVDGRTPHVLSKAPSAADAPKPVAVSRLDPLADRGIFQDFVSFDCLQLALEPDLAAGDLDEMLPGCAEGRILPRALNERPWGL